MLITFPLFINYSKDNQTNSTAITKRNREEKIIYFHLDSIGFELVEESPLYNDNKGAYLNWLERFPYAEGSEVRVPQRPQKTLQKNLECFLFYLYRN